MYQDLSGGKEKTSVNPISKNIVLNKEQINACELIKDFVKDDRKEYFCLIGKAGTGKTTVLAKALEGYSNILGITISHQAKDRLSSSIQQCYTYASAVGLKLVRNGAEQNFVPDPKAKGLKISSADLIVFDECSQVSRETIKIIHEKKKSSAKVIYVGDFRQLPPVECDLGEDSKTFLIKDKAELVERVRQGEGNPLLDSSDLASKEIEEKTYDYNKVKHTIFNTDEKLINGKGLSFSDDFLKDFKDCYDEDSNTKVIAFRTKTVEDFNFKIRQYIYSNSIEDFVPGEKIIALSNYVVDDTNILINSKEYVINTARKLTHKKIECYSVDIYGVREEILLPSKIGKKQLKAELNKAFLRAVENPRNWKDYWELKSDFAMVDYSYAINCYKSQGGTYKNVFLDMNDIASVTKISPKAKCQSIYVGITRASHKLIIIDV